MTNEELKQLFKTGDTVSEQNMAQLIDDCGNEVSLVTSIEIAGGLSLNYLHTSKHFSIWFSGVSAAEFTIGTYNAKTLLANTTQFPELASYQGEAMSELLSIEVVGGLIEPVCFIEIGNTGVYAYLIGASETTIPVGCKFHYKTDLILNV